MSERIGCSRCLGEQAADLDFSMAFQPIVDLAAGEVFAYEALARGPNGEPASSVLGKVTPDNRYTFDQACRTKAIELVSRLGIGSARVSINFLPNAVYRPEACIRQTLLAADKAGFVASKIIFEVTEGEAIDDRGHLLEIFRYYRRRGFVTAIDDFGAGHSGLGLLTEFQPDVIKLDMALIRGIDADRARQIIVRHQVAMCADLGVRVLAEGVETMAELDWLDGAGIELFQGYLLARPAFEALPGVPLLNATAAEAS